MATKSTIKASKTSIKPGQSNTITITRSSSSYTHTIKYTVGKLSGTVATKTTSTKVNVTIPLDAITQSPNKSQTCTITCTTYNGSTSLGSSTCTFAVAPYSPTYVISVGFSDAVLGEALSINLDKDNSNFTSDISYTFEGGASTVVATKTADAEVSFTTDVETLAALVPTKSYGTLLISVTTYYKTTKIGATQTDSITLSVPEDVKPTCGNITWEDTSGYAAKYGAPVAGKSTLKVSTTANGIYGSRVKNITFKIGNGTYTGAYNTEQVAASWTAPANYTDSLASYFTYFLYCFDTRGYKSDTHTSENIPILPYKAPQIRYTYYRCDANGNKLDNGTYVKFNIIHTYTSLNKKNSKHITILRDNASIYSAELEEYSSDDTIILGGWSRDVVSNFKIELTDDFTTTSVTGKVEPTFTLINFKADGTGIAFGDVSTRSNSIEMGMPVYIKKVISFDSAGGNSAIYASGNNLYIGTSAANSYVTISDMASASGTAKWLLTKDGKLSISQGVCAGTGGAFSGLDSNGAEHRLIGVSGSNNVFINPIEDGTGTTNIYGGSTGIVQFGSTSAPVDLKHNGHDIYDTVYNRSTTTTSVPNNSWTTLTAKVTLHKGLWIIFGKVQFSSASGKRRGIRIYNSTDAEQYSISQTVVGGSSTSGGIMVNTMVVQNIAATKVYTVQAYQDTGAAVNVTESVLQAVCVG